MARINTNVSALISNVNLAKSQTALNQSLQRLSSGLRINSGADDPAGLIASQGLQAEISGLNSAIANSQRATNVVATADGALSEVSNLLISIQGLVVQAANAGGMSADEIQANQLQVDSAIASITRISNTASFGGLNLLDGSLGYVTSGVSASALHDVNITGTTFGTHATIPVSVNVITSAQPAHLQFLASSITKSISLQIAGATGVQVLSFVSGTPSTAIAFAINQVSDSTGVMATINNVANAASGISLNSSGFGSKQFVSVTLLGNSGSFVTRTPSGSIQQRSVGQDAVATINGVKAIGDGLKLSVSSPSLSMSLNLDTSFGVGTESFTITGGGALFQLGAGVQTNQQVDLGISSVSASSLGNAENGYLSDIITGGKASLVGGHSGTASQIVSAAITQIAVLRGRLGAFEQNTLNTNINSLQVALENVTASNSVIVDTNFASETSNLTRAQVLQQAGTSVLAQANSSPQTVLALLK